MISKKARVAQLVAAAIVAIAFSKAVTGQENIQYTQGKIEETMSNSLAIPLMNYKGRGIDLPISLNYS